MRIIEDATSFQIGNPENYEEGTKIPLSFEYLDKDHGATIQIVHNGQGNTLLKVEGKIKGGHGPKEIGKFLSTNSALSLGPMRFNQRQFYWFSVITYLVAGVALFITRIVIGSGWGYIIGGLICLFASFNIWDSYSRDQVPTTFMRDL